MLAVIRSKLAVGLVSVICAFSSAVRGGDPNSHCDGGFDSGLGWVSVGGFFSVNVGQSRGDFEGRANANAYTYCDLATDALTGDFELRSEVLISSYNPNPNAIVAGVSDTIGKYSQWANGLYAIVHQNLAVGRFFGINAMVNGVPFPGAQFVQLSSFQWELDVRYYLTLKRESTAATLTVYSDPARTNALGSLTISNIPTGTFRYLYAFTGAWACCQQEVIYGSVDSFEIGAPCANPGVFGDVFPCGGDGFVNTDDVLALLDSFAGSPPCPDPCGP